MSTKTFNGDQKIKLTQIVNEGMQVLHEIDTLQGGLTKPWQTPNTKTDCMGDTRRVLTSVVKRETTQTHS